MDKITEILVRETFSQEHLVALLSADTSESATLFDAASAVRQKFVGEKVYIRAIIEVSNKCEKNCFYCGLRHDNKHLSRYLLDEKEVMQMVRFAWENGFHSVVLQSGEITTRPFIRYIDNLLHEITRFSQGRMAVTLSCGEQDKETYRRWFESGASRYLLRIETSNQALYRRIHPDNTRHSFENRIKALQALKETGYYTGTGVMIGLPFQTLESLASDILFMQQMDVDMVGMGPYLEHQDTPLFSYRSLLQNRNDRLFLALKMIAVLRLVMKDIHIAATTALHAIAEDGREQALQCGANILMPDLTPAWAKEKYLLYEGKPNLYADPLQVVEQFRANALHRGLSVAWNDRGDPVHARPLNPELSVEKSLLRND